MGGGYGFLYISAMIAITSETDGYSMYQGVSISGSAFGQVKTTFDQLELSIISTILILTRQHAKGWEPTFLIRVFGLFKERLIEVDFAVTTSQAVCPGWKKV